MLGHILLWISIPFVVVTLIFGFYKGGTVYYESDLYDGNGTAHPVLFEETTCARREIADGQRRDQT